MLWHTTTTHLYLQLTMLYYYTTGKTNSAHALAHYYNTPVLTVDDVVTEALYYSGSPAAVAARLQCTEAHLAAADPSPTTDPTTDKPAPAHRQPRTLHHDTAMSTDTHNTI